MLAAGTHLHGRNGESGAGGEKRTGGEREMIRPIVRETNERPDTGLDEGGLTGSVALPVGECGAPPADSSGMLLSVHEVVADHMADEEMSVLNPAHVALGNMHA